VKWKSGQINKILEKKKLIQDKKQCSKRKILENLKEKLFFMVFLMALKLIICGSVD
jgi:hypothetical protein